jgi:hypothetical protein
MNLGSAGVSQAIRVSVGEPVILDSGTPGGSIVVPITIGATVGTPGGSLLVRYRVSRAGKWRNWPPGTVSVDTVYGMLTPCEAIEVTATGADGAVEFSQ